MTPARLAGALSLIIVAALPAGAGSQSSTAISSDEAAVIARTPRTPGLHDVTLPARDVPGHVYVRRVYVPDEGNGDAALRAFRRRFVGRTVYGFGGVMLRCEPAWNAAYKADTGFTVRAVERDHTPASLATGTTAAWSGAAVTRYVAIDPLRFLVALPKQPSAGANFAFEGPADRCPALTLADWQVDRTLSLTAPPRLRFGDPPGRLREVRVGATRREVMWRLGYPTGFEPSAGVRTEREWTYDRVALESFSVGFRGDRVVSVTDRSIHLP